jgi:hypothetical protein
MKNNDKGMGELLELLKTHPKLVSALVFDPTSVNRLLRSKAARRLILGVDTRAFLRYIVGPENGGPMAVCSRKTAAVCKGTQHLLCSGGTRPTKALPKSRRNRAVGRI